MNLQTDRIPANERFNELSPVRPPSALDASLIKLRMGSVMSP